MAKAQAEGQQEIDEANWQSKKNLLAIKETTATIKKDDAVVKKSKRDADARWGALKVRKNVNKFREYAVKASGGYSRVSLGDGNVSSKANRNKFNAVIGMVAQKEAIAEESGGQILRRKYNENDAIYKATIAQTVQNFIPQAGSPGRFWADQNQFMRGINPVNQIASAVSTVATAGGTGGFGIWGG